MRRLRYALAAASVAVLSTACSGNDSQPDPDATASVAAVPDVPHADGPIRVRLQPALTMPASAMCEPVPADHIACSPDGTRTFKMLGAGSAATVSDVATASSDDHTTWATTIRLAPDSRPVATAAAERAGAFGGVLLVLEDGQVVAVLSPADVRSGTAHLLGLEKAEAWAVVDAFRP